MWRAECPGGQFITIDCCCCYPPSRHGVGTSGFYPVRPSEGKKKRRERREERGAETTQAQAPAPPAQAQGHTQSLCRIRVQGTEQSFGLFHPWVAWILGPGSCEQTPKEGRRAKSERGFRSSTAFFIFCRCCAAALPPQNRTDTAPGNDAHTTTTTTLSTQHPARGPRRVRPKPFSHLALPHHLYPIVSRR